MGDSLRDGRFVLLGPLGEGSQGTTFAGVDKREGRPVAIKRFEVRGARSWKDVELAEREARVLSALHHRRLPAYVDHFEEGGVLYLVMEKVEGESLAALRKRGATFGEGDAVRLLRDAAEVLEYLHDRPQPVIHRDLKPGNVIRRPDGSHAFVDFGAVRDKLRPEGGSTVVGTFGYMAPEQFQGRASPGSDVYAIGATALAMLTGSEPENLPHKGLAIDVEAALGDRVSRPLVRALARMLEPDPDERPQRLGPLLDALPRPEAKRRGREEARRAEGEAPARSDEDDRPSWERRMRAELERWQRRMEAERRGWERWPDASRARWEEAIGRAEREWEARIADAVHGWGRSGDEQQRSARRKAERWARHAERRAERARRRAEEHALARARGPVPWPIALVVSLALTLATVAVTLALRVVVPVVLMLLSLVFGRALRDAAKDVAEEGRRASEALRAAQRQLGAKEVPDAAAALEADAARGTPGRARIADPGAEGPDDDAELDAFAEVDALEEAEAARERAERSGRR
jgi:hypothetical protein